MTLPLVDDVPRAGSRAVPGAAHPLDDVEREPHPDLLVVLELGVVLEVGDSGEPRRLVQGGIEREAVAQPGARIAVRPELGPGTEQGEVDIEEDCAQHRSSIGVGCSARPRARGQRPGRQGGFPGNRVPNSSARRTIPLADFRSDARNRGAQIRTGGLSDPNGARYQAAPHPERVKGSDFWL